VSLHIAVLNGNENLLLMHFIPNHFQDTGKVIFPEGAFFLDGMTTIH
jgi:hypothetical protein